MVEFSVRTSPGVGLVDVTAQVQRAIAETKVDAGIVTLMLPHTTAALVLTERADPDVAKDVEAFLEKLVGPDGAFKHAEGNSPAHIKSALVGPSLSLIVQGGRAVLGTWQGIFLCEFDGPRTRRVLVKAVAG